MLPCHTFLPTTIILATAIIIIEPLGKCLCLGQAKPEWVTVTWSLTNTTTSTTVDPEHEHGNPTCPITLLHHQRTPTPMEPANMSPVSPFPIHHSQPVSNHSHMPCHGPTQPQMNPTPLKSSYHLICHPQPIPGLSHRPYHGPMQTLAAPPSPKSLFHKNFTVPHWFLPESGWNLWIPGISVESNLALESAKMGISFWWNTHQNLHILECKQKWQEWNLSGICIICIVYYVYIYN